MRRRRRGAAQDEPEEEPTGADVTARTGPFDAADVDLEAVERIDLGSLLLPAREDLAVQVQIDEESGQVMAVLVGNEEGAVEVRAFAAAKSGGMWAKARREIAADATRQGGTATEQDGPMGPELFCQIPVTMPDGQNGVQPSRVLGYDGPRWFLKATLLGQPALQPETEGPFVEVIRDTVVRRGGDPMPPGEALPVQLPPQAEPIA